MKTSWRWIAVGALVVVAAVAAVLLANGLFANRGTGLTNTNWSLVSINGQAPVAAATLTLQFQSGTQLVGDSGCNSYGGQYQVSGSRITVSQLTTTLRACVDQSLNDQEAVFQSALGHAAQFSMSGNQLTLKNASGGEVLVFAKQ